MWADRLGKTIYALFDSENCGRSHLALGSPASSRKVQQVRDELEEPSVGELVWTCLTDTFNPSNVKKAIDRLVKLVVEQMQRDGLQPSGE
jgi:hypothetical protein